MREKPIDGLNMIPFIDIMLVLLTIVLTTSSFIASGTIPINLPQATESAPTDNDVQMIELNAQGVVYFDAKPVSIEQLKLQIDPLDRNTSFLLRADASVQLQSFVDVADALKQLGFTKVAVQTENKNNSLIPQVQGGVQ